MVTRSSTLCCAFLPLLLHFSLLFLVCFSILSLYHTVDLSAVHILFSHHWPFENVDAYSENSYYLKTEHDHLLLPLNSCHPFNFYGGVPHIPFIPLGLVLKLCAECSITCMLRGGTAVLSEILYHGIGLVALLAYPRLLNFRSSPCFPSWLTTAKAESSGAFCVIFRHHILDNERLI